MRRAVRKELPLMTRPLRTAYSTIFVLFISSITCQAFTPPYPVQQLLRPLECSSRSFLSKNSSQSPFCRWRCRLVAAKDDHANVRNKESRPLSENRRNAILAVVSAALLFPTATMASSASNLDALEDLDLGVGQWTQQPSAKKPSSAMSFQKGDSFVPPSFTTYAARFLIQYDVGLSTWWKETQKRYSLLPAEEKDEQLSNHFGHLAMSVQLALEQYLQKPDSAIKGEIKQKTTHLCRLFLEKYGAKDVDAPRQIGMLFAMLPMDMQPEHKLLASTINERKVNNFIVNRTVKNDSKGDDKLHPLFSAAEVNLAAISESRFKDEIIGLLPPKYSCIYNVSTKTYTIQPYINIHDVGRNGKFGQNSITTAFGPLASTPLKREQHDLSIYTYAIFGISGAAGCAITHSLVIPLDVVKTRLQTNPGQYSTNIINGAVAIVKNEGLGALLLGSQATLAGYLWYGLSVYPSYSFFKHVLGQSLFSPEFVALHMNSLALVSGALAAVLASLGLTPMEACRIRTVAEPKKYKDIGLLGTLNYIANEDESLGWKTLYAGFPSLLTRQVVFGSIKFLAFERACETLFALFPELRASTFTALGVSLLAGGFSGALSSVVSQPADSVLTYVSQNANGKGNLGVIEGCRIMIENEGIASLFRGLGSRCMWATCIIAGQFFLYDTFRHMFGVAGEDLSQVFEVIIPGPGVV